MYLTEIPKPSASWLSSAVNVYGYQPMEYYILFFRQQSTWMRQARNHDFKSGK